MDLKFIDETKIEDKKVFLRTDFNISLTDNLTIADDYRIKQTLPTIHSLLAGKNKLIIASHLDRPEKRDPKYSMKIVADRLQEYLKGYKVILVQDFIKEKEILEKQTDDQIVVLENLRFFKGEESDSEEYAKMLSSLAQIYVNDAFGVCHRTNASITGIPKYLPAYGGLLLKREIEMMNKILNQPSKPFVAIVGGAKIESKIDLISKLTEIADYVLIGGALANTFLCAYGYEIGKSYCEYEKVARARKLLFLAGQKHTAVYLPSDVILDNGKTCKIDEIPQGSSILDIGPQTQAQFGAIIAKAKTIVWNGPLGYFEDPAFGRGTEFVFHALAHNKEAFSVVGGGDTIAAVSKEEYLKNITHLSTGGGAMLEYIERGTLPGIEALKKST